MSARFVQYEAGDLEPLYKAGFEPVAWKHSTELVLRRPTNSAEVFIYVFTSIRKDDGEARNVGEDAGRVVLMMEGPEGARPVWKARRVHRTKSFVENLVSRAREAWKAVAALARCPQCGALMVARRKHGEKVDSFYGCSRFPKCRGTRPLPQV